MQVNLRHVRYFLMVAEELHFGRAAARLNMAQPALSQRIQALELELQVVLFTRSKRKVELTPAGHSFLSRSRQILADFDDAVLVAQRTHRNETGQLSIGTIPNGMGGMLFREILPEFKQRFPRVNVLVQARSTTNQIAALHNGQLDVALIRMPVTDPLLSFRAIYTDQLAVALPAGHPKARAKVLSLAAVADEPQIMFPRHLAPDYYDFLIGLLKSTGGSFTVAHEADHLETHLGLVAGGFGVALMPSKKDIQYAGVVYRPLRAPCPTIETAFAFLRGRETKLIKSFVDIASAIVQKARGRG